MDSPTRGNYGRLLAQRKVSIGDELIYAKHVSFGSGSWMRVGKLVKAGDGGLSCVLSISY